jgi:ComF family protein
LVGGIKFRARMNLIRLLGNLLADALLSADGAVPAEQPQAILPVPLHPARLRQRGYNQALELARVVGRRLSIPVDASSCQRTRATRAQSELEERQRLQNIRGAFATTGRLPRHLAILDDVVTTGATVSELARALHRGGCERVDVWTLARTP